MMLLNRFVFVLLCCAFLHNSGFARAVCEASDGYRIEYEFEYLEPYQFNESFLREFFRKYVERQMYGELRVFASSDRALLDEIENPKFFWASTHESSVRSVWTEQPVAYFFRIEENSFVQYRDREGNVDWFTLKGENLFHRQFGSITVTYLGQDFPGVVKDPCERIRRVLFFQISDAVTEDVRKAASFYDSLFDVPWSFSFFFYESVEDMFLYHDTRFPALEVKSSANRELDENALHGPTEASSYAFYRARKDVDRIERSFHTEIKGKPSQVETWEASK